MVWKSAAAGLAVVTVALVLGCSGGDSTAEISGQVLLDGQPLAEGVIHFIPVDGKSNTESTFVVGGRFNKRIPLGKHRVEISCVTARPLRPGQDADSATGSEIVPSRYNTESELEMHVNKRKNEVRFDLSSK